MKGFFFFFAIPIQQKELAQDSPRVTLWVLAQGIIYFCRYLIRFDVVIMLF